MALFGQLAGAATNDNQSLGDALGNYFQKRMDQDFSRIGANTAPQTSSIPSAPAVPQAPAVPAEQPQAPAPVAGPVAPPPITPVPTASQILSQPPGQLPAIPQAPQQVPTPGQAQMQPQAPIAPVAPPTPGQAAVEQTPAQQLQQPQAPAQQPLIAGQPTSDVGATPTEQAINQQQQQPQIDQHTQNLMDWQNDPGKVSLIANDKRTPEEGGPPAGVKVMANRSQAEYYKDIEKKNAETKQANDMIANNDSIGLANAMKRRSDEEGSYLKAYLFHRFGLNDLAKQEQQKLGAGSTMEQVQMPDGSTALVRVRADGGISYGHDVETGRELNAKQLESISGQVANSKTAQTQAVHAYTTEKLRLQKLRDESLLNGATEAELIRDGLDNASIENQARKLGASTLEAARGRYFTGQPSAGAPSVAGQTQANLGRGEQSAMQITPNNKVAAADWAHDAGLPVISGHRTKEQQAALFDHYDANGVARTATGRPLAEAGTSKHETYDAFDVDPKKMTPEMETMAREAGFKNDIKGDPNHWYRETTAPGERTTTPKVANFVDNWQRRRENEPRAAWIARQKVSGQEVDDLGHGLIDGRISTTDLTGRDANVRRYAIERAIQLDPKWNTATSAAMKKSRMDFTSGRTSNQVLAHTTALGQVAMVEEAFKAQQNGDTQALNAIKRRYEIETGSSLPIATNTAVGIFGPEVIKSIVPGGGALHDRLEAKGLLNPNMSPPQFKAAMDVIKEFQGESLLALRNKWTSSGLPRDQFRDQILADSPDAQDALDAADKHRTGRREAAANPTPAPATVDHAAGAQAERDRRRKARGY